MPIGKELTDLQEAFVDEYTIDFNASKAAVRAGYKDTPNVRKIASELLKKPEIIKRLKEKCKEITERNGLKRAKVIQQLMKIAFYDIGDYVDIKNGLIRDEIDELDTSVLSEIKITENPIGIHTTVKFYDKLKALELLSKYMNMFTERVETVVKDDRSFIKQLSDEEINESAKEIIESMGLRHS